MDNVIYYRLIWSVQSVTDSWYGSSGPTVIRIVTFTHGGFARRVTRRERVQVTADQCFVGSLGANRIIALPPLVTAHLTPLVTDDIFYTNLLPLSWSGCHLFKMVFCSLPLLVDLAADYMSMQVNYIISYREIRIREYWKSNVTIIL